MALGANMEIRYMDDPGEKGMKGEETTYYVINGRGEHRKENVKVLEKQLGNVWGIDKVSIQAKAETLTPCAEWICPEGTKMLTKGEVECMAGHILAWEAILASGDDSGIVLEDDAVVSADIDWRKIRGDLCYLGGHPMEPVSDDGRVGWWYVTVAYWLTKETAQKLIDAVRGVIPSDNYLSWHTQGSHSPVIPLHEQAEPLELEVYSAGTSFTQENPGDSGTVESPPAVDVKVVTFSNDQEKSMDCLKSYSDKGFDVDVLQAKDSWDTSGRGGIQKVKLLREWVKDKDLDGSVILVSDSYDVRNEVTPDDLLKRYAEAKKPILVSGENNLWPHRGGIEEAFESAPRTGGGPAIYPCSGLFMATGKHLKNLLEFPIQGDDDQEWLQDALLRFPQELWAIDSESYVFGNLSGANAVLKNGYTFFTDTNCWCAIVHANGPSEFLTEEPAAATDISTFSGDVPLFPSLMTQDIMTVPLLTYGQCLELIRIGNENPGLWKPLPGDNVPGDELRIKEIDQGLYDWLVEQLRRVVSPHVASHWHPTTWKDPCDLFMIRYSPEKQAYLRLHNDISVISGSVKLRSACSGGELYFPRQGYSDRLTRCGDLTLWPGQVTHPHQVLPVSKGMRISLIVWTP